MVQRIGFCTAAPFGIMVGHDAFCAWELEKSSAETLGLEKEIRGFGKKKDNIARQTAGLKKQMTERPVKSGDQDQSEILYQMQADNS